MSRSLAESYPRAFVTGASGGLGRAFTEMLLAEGVQVWGTARDTGRLVGIPTVAAPARFVSVALDLGDSRSTVDAWEGALRDAGGAFDLVIQNAGYGVFGEFTEVEFPHWEAQLAAMLVTTARVSHLALRSMRRANRGCLVHVSSLATEFPLPFMSGYNVAKAGLSALSESLVFETRGTDVSVIDFRPGDYRTAFNQTMQNRHRELPQTPADPRVARAWSALEANLRAGPPAAQAAADLRRALLDGRRGVVRSGTFFQACLAPFFRRLAPAFALRAAMARYFGST